MIIKKGFTCFFIIISLLLVLVSCNNESQPPVEKENTCSYVQNGDTFIFTDGTPRYMIRYNSSPDKSVAIADTGYIKSYSTTIWGNSSEYP